MVNNRPQLKSVPNPPPEPAPEMRAAPDDPWSNWDGEEIREVPASVKLAKIAEAKSRKLKEKAAKKRKKGESDYDLTRKVVEGFKGPLSWYGANFRVFSEAEGWKICDEALKRACHLAYGKNAEKALMPIIAAQLAIPSLEDTADAPIYWEREGGLWEGEWKPLNLGPDEILYTDRIVNVVTEEATEITGRIIHGPMISLPWGTEDEERDYTEFERLMETRIPDPAIRDHFQEVCGTLLQPHMPLRGQIVLWGPPGTAKTTIARAISYAAAGASGVSEQPESALAKTRWAPNSLVNRFANISDDSERVTQWIGFVKRYTSGTFIAEAKYGQPTAVTAMAKLISTCNEFQDVADASGAMVDRLIPFKLTCRVEGEWNPEIMTARYWCRMDRRIKMVEWLATGLARLRKRGRFSPPENWNTQKAEAVSAGDPVEGWLLENLKCENDAFLKTSDLMNAIRESGNFSSQEFTRLERAMPSYLERLFGAEPLNKRMEGARYRGYVGVKLVE